MNELKEICFKKQIKAAQAIGLKRVFINADFELIERLDPVATSYGKENGIRTENGFRC